VRRGRGEARAHARADSPARYLLSLIYYYIIVMLLFIYWPEYAINKRSAGISADATQECNDLRSARSAAPGGAHRNHNTYNQSNDHSSNRPEPLVRLPRSRNLKPIVREISPTRRPGDASLSCRLARSARGFPSQKFHGRSWQIESAAMKSKNSRYPRHPLRSFDFSQGDSLF